MSIFGLNLSTTDLWLLGVCGTLVMAWVGFLLASTLNKRSRHNQAADLFRSKILSELEGFYPTIHCRTETDYSKIKETIPRVERLAAEFGHCLGGTTKRKFDQATRNYCEYCKGISKTHDMADALYPSMWKTDGGEILNDENLSKHVDHLLSFARPK